MEGIIRDMETQSLLYSATDNLIEQYSTIDICRHLLNGQLFNHNYKKQDIHESIEEDKRVQNREVGVIHVYFNKDMIARGQSVCVSSFEKLEELSPSLTHWTPQVYMWGAKNNKGRNKNNVRAYTTFVVEMDQNVSLEEIFYASALAGLPMPTAIVNKGRGPHIYYRCSNPFYGSRKARWTFERMANCLRDMLSEYLPIDPSTNVKGIFRIPKKEDVIFYNPFNVVKSHDMKKQASKSGYLTTIKVISKEKTMKPSRFINDMPQSLLNTDFMKSIISRTDVKGSKGQLGRDNWMFTIALAYKADQLKEDQALDKCLKVNKSNIDPLSAEQVQKCVESAYSGKYQGPAKYYLAKFSKVPVTYNYFQFITPAKKRNERTQSHYHEWEKDIVTYLRANTSPDTPFVSGSTRKLGQVIGEASEIKKPISKNSLIETIEKSDEILVFRKKDNNGNVIQKGRKAGIYLALRSVLVHALLHKKNDFIQKKSRFNVYVLKIHQIEEVLFDESFESYKKFTQMSFVIKERIKKPEANIAKE